MSTNRVDTERPVTRAEGDSLKVGRKRWHLRVYNRQNVTHHEDDFWTRKGAQKAGKRWTYLLAVCCFDVTRWRKW